MHPFDASLDLHRSAAPAAGTVATFRCRTSARYRNAIGPFGGWSAALMLKSVISLAEARGAALALDAMFMGAIDDGELEVRVFALRQNRSVGFWRAELWQSGRLCAHAQVTMSTARCGVEMQDARFPQVPVPTAVPVYANPRTPVPWVDQYVFRPVSGLLFAEADSMDARLWIRDADPRPLDAVSLAALCDTPFPSPWIRLSAQVPVSTVNYSVYFRASEPALQEAGEGFCLLDTQASLARDGYVDQFTSVWSESGCLLAQTQQLLWLAQTSSR